MTTRRKKVDRLAYLGSLAGGLAHEIKNPLSTISVNLQLMQEDWEGAETPREKRALKRIGILRKEIERLEQILEDFLTYARGFPLEPRPTGLNEVVADLLLFVDPEARRRGIEIRHFADPGLPPVSVDMKYIRLALMNLVQNAMQALEESPPPKQILLRTRRAGDAVEVTVTDTGPGIPEEHRDRIFQVYFSTKRSGTGMGLAMVRRIVEEHDGRVDFQSERGKGTSFRITLPRVPPPAPGGGPLEEGSENA